MNKTLYCTISSHGYGHVGQSVPILKRLHELRPDIDIVIQCAINRDWLQQRFHFPFDNVAQDADFGMVMKDAFTIDAEASHQRYTGLHQQWSGRVTAGARLIGQYQPQLVYSNVDYVTNAAAATLGLPVINLCSLSWYHVYKHYCQNLPGAQQVLDDMLQAYNSADTFLAPQPSMALPGIAHVKTIDTVARSGRNRADEIRAQYNLPEQTRLVMVSLGGVSVALDFDQWPQIDGVCYLVSQCDCPDRDDFIAYESLSMSYMDIFCSCGTIVCKSGYGTYAEAACNGVSVLYTRRRGWPEDPYLVDWLQQHTRCAEISLQALYRGDLHTALRQLENKPRPTVVEAAGIEQAVAVLLQYF